VRTGTLTRNGNWDRHGNHSFYTTGIAIYLRNGGKSEVAAPINLMGLAMTE